MKHTPGPWHSRPVGFRGHMEIFTARDDLIAALHLRGETAANARLVAAAPDLLAALLHVMPHVGTNYSGKQRYDILETARAAIAKATGE